jgi:hypothetical protein
MWLKHPVTKTIALFVVIFSLTVGVSVAKYIVEHPGDAIQQNIAAWARNNDLGAVVDKLEEVMKGDPPSTQAADELALTVDDDLDESASTSSTTPPVTTPTTIVPDPSNGVINDTGRPSPIAPVVTPALDGEGKWVKFAELGDSPIAYATSFRPFADYASVLATAMVFDQSRLTAGLFNGNELPGGKWNNGDRVMTEALPSLVLAFNGGFRFEHYQVATTPRGRCCASYVKTKRHSPSITMGAPRLVSLVAIFSMTVHGGPCAKIFLRSSWMEKSLSISIATRTGAMTSAK